MKHIFSILILSLIFCSCNESTESKILNACKKYTEDSYFKNNLKIEIVDFKINSQKELNQFEADSLTKRFARNEMLSIAVKLSGQTASDFFDAGNTSMEKFITEAKNSREYDLYIQNLKGMNSKGFEAHAYIKYTTSDLNDDNKQNGIREDCVYLLNTDFKVIDMYSR